MTRRSRITIPLSEEDRVEIMIEKEGGKVTDFVVNYVATIAGRDHSVVRYDTNHGFPHKDTLRRDGTLERKEKLPMVDLHWLTDSAIDDLKENWRAYRRRFVR